MDPVFECFEATEAPSSMEYLSIIESRKKMSNLAKKREQMKTMKMPELSEHAECSDSELPPGGDTSTATSTSNGIDGSPSSTTTSTQKSVSIVLTDKYNDDDSRNNKMDTSNSDDDMDKRLGPPLSPKNVKASPSLPPSVLRDLGLDPSSPPASSTNGNTGQAVNGDQSSGDQQTDQLSDKQLESQFNSLALAFRTDRMTLDKRLKIQKRYHEIAENNFKTELNELREAMETLNELATEEEKVQEVMGKIHNHLDFLHQYLDNLSSRAECYGAVKQEKKVSMAMDVMITFTENIRRLRSTEQSEVEEARKVLNSSRQNFSLDTLSIGDRRSASVCAALQNPRTARRRSEVALPRFFGGAGSPLHVTSSMEPRQRFQTATANITVRNVVTNTLRRASMDRQKTLPLSSTSPFSAPSSSSSSATNTLNASKTESSEKTPDTVTKQNSQEEEAYRHGFEEGLKASLSRELTELRDQQTTISSSLDQVMDRVEAFDDDKDDTEIDEAVSRLREIGERLRHWVNNPPNWQSASHTLRKVTAALIFLLALGVVVVTFVPLIPSRLSVRNHADNAQ